MNLLALVVVVGAILISSCSDEMGSGVTKKVVISKTRPDGSRTTEGLKSVPAKKLSGPSAAAVGAPASASRTGADPAPTCGTAKETFERTVVPALQSLGCVGCHSQGGSGAKSAFLLGGSSAANYDALVSMADPLVPGESRYLLKAQGVAPHGGGVRFSLGAPEGRPLVEFATALASDLSCSDAQAGKSMGPHDGMAASGALPSSLSRSASFGEIFGLRRSPVSAPGGLRRLTSKQIVRTMKQLFSAAGEQAVGHQASAFGLAQLPVDAQTGGFRTATATLESSFDLVSTIINKSAPYIFYYSIYSDPLLTPDCGGRSYFPNLDGCVRQFIAKKGKQVFRRSLSIMEQERYKKMFDDVSATGLHNTEALLWVIRSWLVSPQFLYRSELGTPSAAGAPTLKGFELATSLSYLLWNSTPDDELLRAAEAGELEDPSKRDAQVARMIRDPKGKVGALDFFAEWAEIDQASSLNKDLTVRGTESAEEFWKLKGFSVLKEHSDVFFESLLVPAVNVPSALVGQVLVPGSGLAASEFFANPTETGVPERRGFLMHPLFLAVHSHAKETGPVLRGRFVREKVLCEKLPLPPAGVETSLPPAAKGVSERARLAMHSTSPSCAGCHRLMDDLGFALEAFDEVGRYRSTIGSVKVDTTGIINSAGDANGSFATAWEYAELLDGSTHVEKCFVYSLQRYALGREPVLGDANSLQDAYARAKAKGMNYEEIMKAMTSSPAFLERSNGGE